MIVKHSTRLSPFYLAFASEAILATKVIVLATCTKCVKYELKDKALQNEKALINDIRLGVIEHIKKYEEDIVSRYGETMKKRVFKP